MIDWLINNKEWLFSGILVAVIGWFFQSKSASQSQKLGNHSNATQVGGDMISNNPQNGEK